MKKNILTLGVIAMTMLLVLVGALSLLTPKATADREAVQAANELYLAGHYHQAAQIYEGQIAHGVQDSAIYYNLGNAYYQQGDLGLARLNLERAAQIAPRDGEIQANLALVREQTTELFGADPGGPFSLLAQATSWLTLNEMAVAVLALWFLLGFILLAQRQLSAGRGKRVLRLSAVLLLIVLLFGGFSLGSRTLLEQIQPSGVVVVPTVAVSGGPGAEYPLDYNLNSGDQVQLIDYQGDWVQVKTPGGVSASWLPQTAVEPVS